MNRKQQLNRSFSILLMALVWLPSAVQAQWNKVGGTAVAGAGASDIVYSLCAVGTNIYAGGAFKSVYNNATLSAKGIAVWNTGTSTWSALAGTGITGGAARINAIVYNSTTSTLYVGGNFTAVGGVAVSNLAKYVGGVWSSVDGVAGGGVSGGTSLGSAIGGSGGGWDVQALALDASGTLYVGGNFTTVNGAIGYNNIASFNGVSWSNMSGGVYGNITNPSISVSTNATVYAIAVIGGTVYAGGQFTTAGATGGVNNIAQWNGASWSTLTTAGGIGITGAYNAFSAGGNYIGWTQEPAVFSLAADATNKILYVGGEFTNAGNISSTNIAQWIVTSSTWATVGGGMSLPNQDGAQVYALLLYNGGLFAGGDFQQSSPLYAPYTGTSFIAYWDYNQWTAFSSPAGTAGNEGMDDDVLSIAVSSGGTLFVGGIFQHNAVNTPMNYIAQYAGVNILPVELSQFDAMYNEEDKSVDLHWVTESETNSRLFTIEKTKEGSQWEAVGTESGAGNSSQTLSYHSKDMDPWNGLSYYRLKQTDFNGSFTYSRTIAIDTKDGDSHIKLAPNPAESSSILSFLCRENGIAEVRICDYTGRTVQLFSYPVTEGLNSVNLRIDTYQKGLYIVSVNESKRTHSVKLVITH